jgi:hypothetical protein
MAAGDEFALGDLEQQQQLSRLRGVDMHAGASERPRKQVESANIPISPNLTKLT